MNCVLNPAVLLMTNMSPTPIYYLGDRLNVVLTNIGRGGRDVKSRGEAISACGGLAARV